MTRKTLTIIFLGWLLVTGAPAQDVSSPYDIILGRKPNQERITPRVDPERFVVLHGVGVADEVAFDLATDAAGWDAIFRGGGNWTTFYKTSEALDTDVEQVLDRLRPEKADLWFSPVLLSGPGIEPIEMVVSRTIDVRFLEDVSPEKARSILQDVGLEVLEENFASISGVYLARLQVQSTPREVLAAARTLAERVETLWAEPNLGYKMRPSGCTGISGWASEPNWGDLWNLSGTWGVDAPGAWGSCAGGSGSGPLVTIGILDNGIDNPHTDLPASAQVSGVTCIEEGPIGVPVCIEGNPGGTQINDCEIHGTRVAGVTQMVQNSVGGIGIAPEAQILSLKVHWSDIDQGNPNICEHGWNTPNAIAEGIEYARESGVRVLNHSWNIGLDHAVVVDAYYDARLYDNVISFAATGNDNHGTVDPPARHPAVNGVGAIDSLGNRGEWSCVGQVCAGGSDWGPTVAFVAGGVDIFSTDRVGLPGTSTGDFDDFPNGTSFASPLVAGVAALAIAAEGSLRPEQVEVLLMHSTKDLGAYGWNEEFGHGLPQAGKVVELAEGFLFADSFEVYLPGGVPYYWEYYP